MECNKVLSIIIPTYNMSQYINRCLDSLIIKDLDKLEVLVVNDGSKDDSSEKAHVYSDRFPQTFKVIDKENGNYGSCINRGLKELTGRFVKVLDADDWYDTAELNKLIGELEALDDDVDIVLTNYQVCNVNGDTQSIKISEKWIPGKKYDVQEMFNDREFFRLAMHMVLYRSDLFRSFPYHQTEGISYTDIEWVFKPLYYVKNVAFLNTDVYRYFVGREGQTMDPSVKIRTMSHEWKSSISMLDFNDGNSRTITGNLIAYTQFRINIRLVNIYVDSLIYMDDDSFSSFNLKEIDDCLKNNYPKVYDSIALFDVRGNLITAWRNSGKRYPSFIRKTIALGMKCYSKLRS